MILAHPLKTVALVLLACVAVPASRAGAQLSADDLALIVNASEPEGLALARFYATARQIPPDRIIELKVPAADELSFLQYEQQVVPQVRQALRDRGLQAKVKCLATFYGVPLRVAARDVSEKERAEEASVSLQRQAVLGRLATAISDLEAMARARNPRYVAPPGGGELEAYSRRIEAALKVVGSVEREPPSEARSEALRRLTAHLATLMGPDVVRLRLASNPAAAAWFAAPDDRSPAQVQADLRAAAGVLERANENRSSADARAEARATVEKHFGLIELAKLLGGQAQYLSAGGRETSAASLDSELSLLWVTWYPRAGFLPNPLFHRPATARAAPLPALMVSRIDGPTPQIVRDLILASLRTERDGLSGKVVIDAGGAKQLSPDRKNPGYWAYEQTLMDLAKVVKTHVTLPLVMDIAAVPIPPGTAAGVAVYVGWYSVGKYVPGCAFVPGAVGFHIASFEMASMRRADYHGWVPGLLSDGIAATLGPVAEPYLHAFPPADEFFPLVFTGKMTNAEAYWLTQPTTSWMVGFVGDPLYTPFKNKPAMKVEDLEANLRAMVRPTERPNVQAPTTKQN